MYSYEKFTRLRKQRITKAYLEALSEDTHIPVEVFHFWEGGLVQPSDECIKKLANHFCISSDYFLEEKSKQTKEDNILLNIDVKELKHKFDLINYEYEKFVQLIEDGQNKYREQKESK